MSQTVADVVVGVLAQNPPRVVPGEAPAVKPIYRELKPGEERVQGLLQRVECPPGRPIIFTVKLKERVARYSAPRLDAVDYIAHTPDFRGPMGPALEVRSKKRSRSGVTST